MSRVTDAIDRRLHIRLYRYMIDNGCTIQQAAMNTRNRVAHFTYTELVQLIDAAVIYYRGTQPVDYVEEKATATESFNDLLIGEGYTVGDVVGKGIKWRTPNNEHRLKF